MPHEKKAGVVDERIRSSIVANGQKSASAEENQKRSHSGAEKAVQTRDLTVLKTVGAGCPDPQKVESDKEKCPDSESSSSSSSSSSESEAEEIANSATAQCEPIAAARHPDIGDIVKKDNLQEPDDDEYSTDSPSDLAWARDEDKGSTVARASPSNEVSFARGRDESMARSPLVLRERKIRSASSLCRDHESSSSVDKRRYDHCKWKQISIDRRRRALSGTSHIQTKRSFVSSGRDGDKRRRSCKRRSIQGRHRRGPSQRSLSNSSRASQSSGSPEEIRRVKIRLVTWQKSPDSERI